MLFRTTRQGLKMGVCHYKYSRVYVRQSKRGTILGKRTYSNRSFVKTALYCTLRTVICRWKPKRQHRGSAKFIIESNCSSRSSHILTNLELLSASCFTGIGQCIPPNLVTNKKFDMSKNMGDTFLQHSKPLSYCFVMDFVF